MRNPLPIPFITVKYFIGLRPPNTATCSLFKTVNYFIGLRPPNTDTSSYSQPSITPSDCVLLQAADVGILGTFTFASIIPSCSFTFASIIPSCSFPFLRVIPTLFSFSLKIFYFTCSCYFFDHYQFELISYILC